MLDGMTKRPMGMPLLKQAFLDCVMWVAGEPAMVKAFQEETGMKLGETPLDRMIDEATGYDRRVIVALCDWVTVNVWGEEPESTPAPTA